MVMLSESPREQGETSLPSLGDILAAMDEAREFFPKSGTKELNMLPVYGGKEVKKLQA
jgi:hypothetical protein